MKEGIFIFDTIQNMLKTKYSANSIHIVSTEQTKRIEIHQLQLQEMAEGSIRFPLRNF